MFGNGVLNDAIRPATPTGRRTVDTARCAMAAGIVPAVGSAPSPATKNPISIAASVSPGESAGRLPRLLGDHGGNFHGNRAKRVRSRAQGPHARPASAPPTPAAPLAPQPPRHPRRPRPTAPRCRKRGAVGRPCFSNVAPSPRPPLLPTAFDVRDGGRSRRFSHVGGNSGTGEPIAAFRASLTRRETQRPRPDSVVVTPAQ